MLGSFRKPPDTLAALERVKGWTRERFSLPEDVVILVTEVACSLPGCPPLETVVAFWTNGDKRYQFKAFKPPGEVTEDDIPFYWLKDSLHAPDTNFCACC